MSEGAVETTDRRVEVASNGAYRSLVGGIAGLINDARRAAARSVNAAMTAAYWLIGRHMVEFEQGGRERGEYGSKVVERLAADLTQQFGRGFSRQNLWQMRQFYASFPAIQTASEPVEQASQRGILQTPSGELVPAAVPTPNSPDASGESLHHVAVRFPLPWSAYVRLLSVKNSNARQFYEAEALRGGWTVRQLDRQISSQFYERTALSKNKAKMLGHGAQAQPADAMLRSKPSRTRSCWSS